MIIGGKDNMKKWNEIEKSVIKFSQILYRNELPGK